MALTLDDLFASPDHYLHSFEGGDALFVPMDRAAYARSIFLDRRISPAGGGVMRLPLQTFAGKLRPPRPASWIFHVAHCGSTLLARALDGENLVLREPLALRQVAIRPDPGLLRLTVAMIAKRYAPDLPTIVKANVPVNFLLPEIAALDPAARAILLHLDLPDYLLAILRDAKHREWLRHVTAQLGARAAPAGLPDAALAGALWLAQLRAFAAAIAALPHARSLDAERFFADPQPVLRAAADHLGAPLGDADLAARVAGPLFATYSKDPAVAFDNAARLRRRAALETALSDEIAQAERWVEQAAPDLATIRDTIAAAAL